MITTLVVYYQNQQVALSVNDIAYILYHERMYYITSLKGIAYEAKLDYSFADLAGVLDQEVFFKINETTIVSRQAIKAVYEDEYGNFTLDLDPKPMFPKSFHDHGGSGLFDHLNYN